MNITKTMLALFGAAVLATGAFAEGGPSITLNRVQQRYPWNGMVDIDYTVDLAGADSTNYFVRFQADLPVGDVTKTITMGAFLDITTLTNAVEGSYCVTWDSTKDFKGSLITNAQIKAQLVYFDGDMAQTPYLTDWCYTIIDISEGPSATGYLYWNEYLSSFDEATNKYNRQEYKTDKIVLRRIQPGTFIMGSPEDEYGRESANWASPETQHPVTLTEAFYIGMFPITQKQWENVMATNPASFKPAEGETDPTVLAEKAACPVEMVRYQDIRGTVNGVNVSVLSNGVVDATSFLGILREKSGLTDLDLPTEAQWEFAARAGTTTSTFFGNNVTNWQKAAVSQYLWSNYNANSKTHGVGQVIPNQWGLYDTLGNVWELTLDATNDACVDWGSEAQTDPLRAVGGSVIGRGSAYHIAAFENARAAVRIKTVRASRASFYGFRLSRHSPIADLHK